MKYARKRGRRFWLPAGIGTTIAVALAAVFVTGAVGKTTATPIKIAIMTDCKGAYGAFYDSDIGGAIAAFSQFTGAKPKDPNKPSAGMVGGVIGGHPIQIVGYGCGDDTVPLAVSEIKRLM